MWGFLDAIRSRHILERGHDVYRPPRSDDDDGSAVALSEATKAA